MCGQLEGGQVGRESWIQSGTRGTAQGPPGWQGQDSPSHMSLLAQGGSPDCQAGAPPTLPRSPDMRHLIAWVFYFFPVNLNRGTKAGPESSGTGPTYTRSGTLSLPPPYLWAWGP